MKQEKSGTVNTYDSRIRENDFKALQKAKDRESKFNKTYVKKDSKTTFIKYY